MKFTAYEAAGIEPLVAASPILGWLYRFLSVQTTSNLIGVAELAIAAMIALRPVSARVALAGSALAVGMFPGGNRPSAGYRRFRPCPANFS